jgi:DNA-binding NtrC family response regulator
MTKAEPQQGDSSGATRRCSHPDFAHLNLVGESVEFLRVLNLLPRLSRSDATVLIRGETGTGKELVARAIHYLSRRRTGPFIAINCGAIPDLLVESELFGHVRGAFTDAKEFRQGVVAQSDGGTLLLDEVDTLSVRSQVTLLRFLQDRQYKPVGATQVLSADVRVVGATNADLEGMVGKGLYRQDLLYRLNVLAIQLPALRERTGDAQMLAEVFVRRLSRQYGVPIKAFDSEAIEFLSKHDWPGNVRELENVVHRAFLLSDGPFLTFADAISKASARETPTRSLTKQRFQDAKAHAITEFERTYLSELLLRARGNISLAARISGKERSRLGKLIRKYGLHRDDFVRVEKPLQSVARPV